MTENVPIDSATFAPKKVDFCESWYNPDIKDLPVETRALFEQYCSIPAEDVVDHIQKMVRLLLFRPRLGGTCRLIVIDLVPEISGVLHLPISLYRPTSIPESQLEPSSALSRGARTASASDRS